MEPFASGRSPDPRSGDLSSAREVPRFQAPVGDRLEPFIPFAHLLGRGKGNMPGDRTSSLPRLSRAYGSASKSLCEMQDQFSKTQSGDPSVLGMFL